MTTEAGRALVDWIQRLGNGSVEYDGVRRAEERVAAVEEEARKAALVEIGWTSGSSATADSPNRSRDRA